jgi:DNA-binding beta-propeller fold protein YncE
VPNGAAGLPANPPLVLGLVEDPIHHIIYTGQAPSGGVATFTYSSSGKVSFVGSVASKGAATCWLNISPDGKYLYATDSASDAISVYSLANPLKPSFIQEFYLNGPTNHWINNTSKGPTSEDFQFTFDPTGKYLYVVNHTTDPNFQEGNQLHLIEVGPDGKLSESTGPQLFPASLVTGLTHVDGIALISPAGYYGGYAASIAALPTSRIATASVFSDDNSKLKQLQQTVDELLDAAIA